MQRADPLVGAGFCGYILVVEGRGEGRGGNTVSPVSSAHVMLSTGDSCDLSQAAGSHTLLISVLLGGGNLRAAQSKDLWSTISLKDSCPERGRSALPHL